VELNTAELVELPRIVEIPKNVNIPRIVELSKNGAPPPELDAPDAITDYENKRDIGGGNPSLAGSTMV